jgi:hypothetical protein
MRKTPLFFVLLLSSIWALVAAGCGAGGNGNSSSNGGAGGTGGGSGGQGAGTGGEGGCFLGCGGSSTTSNQGVVVISPQNPTLTVDNGVIPTQAFTATINGADVTSSVTWIFERPEVGGLTTNVFTPTGAVAGIGKLTARVNMDEGTTNVTVFIKKKVNTAGVTPQDEMAFDNPTGGADPSMSVLYPYNETVFPLGVLAPEIQWNGGQAADVYRLRISEKYYEYTGYFTAPPPSRHLIDEEDWKNIEESGTGAQSDPVSMQLTRRSGGTVFTPVVNTWHVAPGRLKGSVYYWELPLGAGNGRILRIRPDSPAVDQFFSPGVCWGCHTVSRDGTKMAAEFNDGNGPLYTVDLVADPSVYSTINPSAPAGNFVFSAFNNTGDKLLASENNSRILRIIDANNGVTLNPNAMGNGCGEPAWSPDGTKIAGICNMSGGGFWTFDVTGGNLTVADVAADGVTVSNIQNIVPQAGGVGRPAYPSFSPGSEWITYGRPTTGSRSTGNGKLWIVAPDGSGAQELSTASSDNKSFNGVFAPLRAGGYFWVVFITRRDYGNTLVNTNRQQLWITAIKDPPTAGDPSHPPFYMRGQENNQLSENAYYALDPCKNIGEDCDSGVDCCNGQCVEDPNNSANHICGEPPPPGTCSADGNSCETTADCCNKPVSTCIDGFCQEPVPE